MKTTAQRLSEVYCRPTVEEGKKHFQHLSVDLHFGVYFDNEYGTLCLDGGEWQHENCSEIPVSQFIDLINDTIADWRLEEDGYNPYTMCKDVDVQIDKRVVWLYHKEGSERIDTNCKTYTQLITLIEMLK